jgi:hypothetical protein
MIATLFTVSASHGTHRSDPMRANPTVVERYILFRDDEVDTSRITSVQLDEHLLT